jgi:hypothetical protein
VAAVQLSGTQTLRFTPTSGDQDYYLLVPSGGVTPPNQPKITSATVSSGNITIVWINGGSLQNSSDLKAWADVPNSSSGTYTTPTAGAHTFYRVKK